MSASALIRMNWRLFLASKRKLNCLRFPRRPPLVNALTLTLALSLNSTSMHATLQVKNVTKEAKRFLEERKIALHRYVQKVCGDASVLVRGF